MSTPIQTKMNGDSEFHLNPITLPTEPKLSALVKRHPLIAYFILAFAGTWITFLPVWLSPRGLGVLPFSLPDAASILLFILATFTGPTLAAFIVTAVESGREGVWKFIRRYGQWRVGGQWYLLVLIGYPLVFVIGLNVALGVAPLTHLFQKLPLILSIYLPAVAMGLLISALGEEPGWRGFALPRLQTTYGPLLGSLILGALHAAWHLPVYFVPGMMIAGPFDPIVFVANSCAIVAATFVWTWLFNNARGSILFAMLIHSVSNASAAYVTQLVPVLPDDPWGTAKLFGLCALLVSIATRGHLSYKPDIIN